jgi:hypothetical protein
MSCLDVTGVNMIPGRKDDVRIQFENEKVNPSFWSCDSLFYVGIC